MSALYSATLFVAIPMPSASSPITSPESWMRIAPIPAGPGLPRAPPSVWSRAFTRARRLGDDEDATAVVAALQAALGLDPLDLLCGQLGVAALARSVLECGGPHPVLRLAELVVEGQEIVRDRAGDLHTLGLVDLQLRIDLTGQPFDLGGQLGRFARGFLSLGAQGLDRLAHLLLALHHVEQLVLHARLLSFEGFDLRLERGQLLGICNVARVHALLLASDLLVQELDLALEPLLLAGDVGVLPVRNLKVCLQLGEGFVHLGQTPSFGKRRAPLLETLDGRVLCLQVEQALEDRWLDFGGHARERTSGHTCATAPIGRLARSP